MLLHCKDRTVFLFYQIYRQNLCLFLQISCLSASFRPRRMQFCPKVPAWRSRLAPAMFCAYIFMDILSPIKDLMESTRGWDSKAFGTVFSLIFAGIILDKMGVRFTAVLSGAVMLTGMTPQEWKNKV